MNLNGDIAYTIFHTYSIRKETVASIDILDSLLHMGFLLETDTIFTINLTNHFTYSGRAFELAGLLLIPYPAFKLDSLTIVAKYRWDERTIRLPVEGKWEENEILPFIFLSGYSNEIHVFGEGTAKALMGKVNILK